MPKYKIGDTLWNAHCTNRQVSKPCPICFKKKEVTLILGNGDQVTLPCQACAQGYEPPTGFVHEYEYDVSPKIVIVDKIFTEQSADGEISTYYSGGYVYHESDLFENKEDAEAEGLIRKIQLESEQLERMEFIKKDQNKSYSWNAGYHIRNAKKLREEAEMHEKKAGVCKLRSKEERSQK